MSEQLPPVDPELRRQLTRRSSGSVPAGLLRDTLARVEQQPGPVRWVLQPSRTLAAFGSLAVVLAVAAALVLVPALQTPPAHALPGYPADRALTTAELADLMSGRAPAVNTTFAASVTIDVRQDVCPMNRAPTIGVIEGMPSQVCAMDQGGGLSFLTSKTLSGIFVFQYWAPGYLGVLGEVTPAPSARLAFRVGDTWPKQGSFLVDAWLRSAHVVGNDPAACPGQTPDQSGSFNCAAYWLSDSESDLSAWRLDVWIDSTYSSPKPGHGVFMVNNDGCQDPASSACSGRVIQARLADNPFPETSTPTSAPTPAPTTRQLEGYPADRALTTAELADLMSGASPGSDTTFVASVNIDVDTSVCAVNRAPMIGVIESMPSQVCVLDQGAGLSDLKSRTLRGTFVFQYWAPGYLGLLGEVTPASTSSLAFNVEDSWPTQGDILVEGWLRAESYFFGSDPAACPGETPDSSGMYYCATRWLSGTADGTHDTDQLMTGGGQAPLGHGVFLLAADASNCPDGRPTADRACVTWRIQTRLADNPFPAAEPTPPATTQPTPLFAPTPSEAPTPPPTPLILPTAPAGAQPLGLWGAGNRPLTVAEFEDTWMNDPQHLGGRIVITKGPIPSAFDCLHDETDPHGVCHFAVFMPYIAQEGYWAVLVRSDGQLSIVGELAAPNGGFVFTVGQVDGGASAGYFIVDGWLTSYEPTCDHDATPKPAGCGPFSLLTSEATDNSPDFLPVQQDAYRSVTGAAGDWTRDGPPVHGLFLIELGTGTATLVAEMATVTP